MPTPSAPPPESIRSLAPRRSLLRRLYLTAAFGLLLLMQVFWSQIESHAEITRTNKKAGSKKGTLSGDIAQHGIAYSVLGIIKFQTCNFQLIVGMTEAYLLYGCISMRADLFSYSLVGS